MTPRWADGVSARRSHRLPRVTLPPTPSRSQPFTDGHIKTLLGHVTSNAAVHSPGMLACFNILLLRVTLPSTPLRSKPGDVSIAVLHRLDFWTRMHARSQPEGVSIAVLRRLDFRTCMHTSSHPPPTHPFLSEPFTNG